MASGDTLLTFHPYNNEPPTGTYATLDTRNSHPILDFIHTGTNENAIFSAIMPRNYAGTTGVTAYIHYSMTSAVTGTVDWDIAFERIGDQQQDVDINSFAAPQSVDNTDVPGVSGLVDIVSISFTNGAQMDNVAVGELFRIMVTRDGINDDATGDAELHAVEIKET